jgi:heme oxygenase
VNSPFIETAEHDAMARIRAATHPQHVALEARAAILERVATPAGYAALIGLFTALHASYEPQFARFAVRFAELGFSLEARSKRALLEQDCSRIRERFSIDAVSPAATFDFPPVDTAAGAVGWLYVLEGSTLGGMVIAGHVAAALAIPTAYYGAYGARSAAMWRDFHAFVRAYVAAEPDSEPAIISGARAAFTIVAMALAKADGGRRAPGQEQTAGPA